MPSAKRLLILEWTFSLNELKTQVTEEQDAALFTRIEKEKISKLYSFFFPYISFDWDKPSISIMITLPFPLEEFPLQF